MNQEISAESLINMQRELEWLMWAEQRDEYESSLPKFISAAWPIIEPANKFMSNWHIDLICDYLQACYDRQIKRLVINIPPRHMKSICVSVMFPAWAWTKNPGLRMMFASYSQSLSIKHSIDRRSIIESAWYQNFWSRRYKGKAEPWVKLRGDQNVKGEFQNTERGVMLATSVGGSATGKGGNFIVVDDPHNPQQALSDAERLQAITFFDQTLFTRLDNPDRDVIIIVMQRLHEADLTGHVLKDIGGYEHLKIPAIQPEQKTYSFPTLGKRIVRAADQLIWPERFSPEYLKVSRVSLGGYGFAGQMMQEPAPSDGAMLKRAWFKYYKVLPSELEREFDFLCSSWDCTFKDSDGTDYVVGQMWGRIGSRKLLLDQVRARMTYTETKAAMRVMFAKWPKVQQHFIEDKANGTAVIDELKSEYTMIAVEPHGGKLARCAAVSPQIEAGNVELPLVWSEEQKDWVMPQWVAEFIDEAAMFPKAMYDDQVDAMTQALVQMSRRSGILDFYKELADKKDAERKAEKEKETHGTFNNLMETNK